jgi:hypothetical protein
MHHHHHQISNWQLEQDLRSLQFQQFWTSCWIANNQARTNHILQEKLNKTNQLLEQMRRAQLTPAERAKEDAERAAERAREEARRARDNKIAGLILFVGLIFCAYLSSLATPYKTWADPIWTGQQQELTQAEQVAAPTPVVQQDPPAVVTEATPTPTPADTSDTAYWEIKARSVSDEPPATQQPPRAQLVKLPKHHRRR